MGAGKRRTGGHSKGNSNSGLTRMSRARIKGTKYWGGIAEDIGSRLKGAAFYLADNGKPSEAFH